MPLLDHFHPPLHPGRNWESFHTLWIGQLVSKFNQRPKRYGFFAEAEVHLGVHVAADVAAFEGENVCGSDHNGSVATEVWAPPAPPLVMTANFADLETFELRVYDEEQGRTLVAIVELVSPGNKDRPESRRAFLDKCATYLREGVSLVVVDVVTSRRHNFHAALLDLFHTGENVSGTAVAELYAIAYRVHVAGERTQIEAWPTSLALGEALPTLPLWLTESLCVPLELEATYRDTCRSAAIG